jgi:membrane-bound lytic murein transglycosylase B
VHIGGGSWARDALRRAGHRCNAFARTPAAALVVLGTPLVLASAVAATPRPAPLVHAPMQDTNVMLAAAVPDPGSITGPSVVPVARPPASFHVASAATTSAPPPSVVVNSPGALRIPAMALQAYRNAERMMSMAQPACGVSWNLLAGIGRIESMHANNGATDARGTAVRPIYGPTLDGSLPGNEVIVSSMAPNGQATYARAMGPMQFLPGTWARYASDGDGDGKADIQNVFDASLAAARYLCTGGLNLRDQSQVLSSILRYNNSMPYARNVLGWAAAYATGVVPVDLPPIVGPVPPVGDAHLENAPEGLGPGLPINVLGLPTTDPMAQMQLVNFGSTDVASQMPSPGWDPTMIAAQNPAQQGIGCPTLVCFGSNPMPPVAPQPASPFPFPFPGAPPPGVQDPQAAPAPGMATGPLPGPGMPTGRLPGPGATNGPLPGPATPGASLPGPAVAGPSAPGPATPPAADPLAPAPEYTPVVPVAPAPGPLPGPGN